MSKLSDSHPEWNLLKFHGKFRDLIPAGFKFQKLYASDYRQYSRNEDGKEYGDTIRVWQHHGGYVEINDWHQYTKTMVEFILNPIELEKNKETSLFSSSNYYIIMLNKKTNSIEIYDYNKHDDMIVVSNLRKSGMADDDVSKIYVEFHETYRKILLGENCWVINYIKEMANRGWIKP